MAITANAFSHWNFLNGVWIACVHPGTFSAWALWINAVVQKEEGRCLLLNLPAGTDSHGLLPPNAWPWLKNHLRERLFRVLSGMLKVHGSAEGLRNGSRRLS